VNVDIDDPLWATVFVVAFARIVTSNTITSDSNGYDPTVLVVV